jgi:CubicO group peptidase (beta-lactamase class C family)
MASVLPPYIFANRPGAHRLARLSRRRALRQASGVLAAAAAAAGVRRALAQDATPIAGDAPVPRQQVVTALEQLDGLVRETLASTGVPGLALAVVHGDETVDARGYGVRAVETGEPVTPETVFPIASMSKPVGSTVVAALVSAGLADWDDRVADLIPGFELSDPWVTHEVRVRDFLCHRSGLPDTAGDVLVDLGYDLDEIVRRARFILPNSSFRSAFGYSNVGYTCGCVAAAAPSGLDWPEASAQFLYAPAGMSSTSSRFADLAAAPNHAVEHVKRDGQWVHLGQTNDDAESPAGGVNAPVTDLARWVRLHLGLGMLDGNRLISAAAIGETHRPQIPAEIPADPNDITGFYGLGWDVKRMPRGPLRISHSGAFNLGAGTNVALVPEAQIGIVVLSNAFPIGVVEALANSFIDLALYGALTTDWLTEYQQAYASLLEETTAAVSSYDYANPPADAMPALPEATYVGQYANDLYGTVEVVAAGDGPELVAGPSRLTWPLTHFDGDVFWFQPVGENAFAASGAIFTVQPNRVASAVRLEYFDGFGQGTLTRVGGA